MNIFFFLLFSLSAFRWKKADVAKTSESSEILKIELQSENEAEKVNGAASVKPILLHQAHRQTGKKKKKKRLISVVSTLSSSGCSLFGI